MKFQIGVYHCCMLCPGAFSVSDASCTWLPSIFAIPASAGPYLLYCLRSRVCRFCSHCGINPCRWKFGINVLCGWCFVFSRHTVLHCTWLTKVGVSSLELGVAAVCCNCKLSPSYLSVEALVVGVVFTVALFFAFVSLTKSKLPEEFLLFLRLYLKLWRLLEPLSELTFVPFFNARGIVAW